MSEEPRKRSRFDQTEPTVDPRRSRSDRRSRSPATRDTEVKAAHSPVSGSVETTVGKERREAAAAAAAAAAARINASLKARQSAQPVDVPPIRSTLSPAVTSSTAKSPSAGGTGDQDIYQQDGDYIKDIEVNDLRNRYTLTKGSTQKLIKEKTGADVTTRGAYYPDKSMATAANPPLYLHITSTTKEGLEKAIAEIDEMMSQDLPNLIDERRFRRRDPEQPTVERDERGRRKWPEEKIPVDLEPIPGFNLRAQVVGQGGSFVKHIQQESRCRVQIKGRGSGFYEHDTGVESDEQMYLHVAGPDPAQVEHGKELCLSLLEQVRANYEQFKERGPRGGDYGDRGDRGNRSGGYGDRGYGDRNNNSYGGYNTGGGGYGGQQSPVAPHSAAAMSPVAGAQNPDLAAQYAQYYAANGGDPYAAYGGYEAYCQMYQQYYGGLQSQTGAQGSPAGAQTTGYDPSAPPPPASDDQAPPPPPPSAGGYNAVPPPPGM